jgi:hypothetical protein
MGALPQVQDACTHTEIMSFIRDGHRSVDVSAELSFEGVSERHIEIMRGELAKIIYEAGRTDIEYMFGNWMTLLGQTERGVNVALRHGSPQTFDLAIGADGLHSLLPRPSCRRRNKSCRCGRLRPRLRTGGSSGDHLRGLAAYERELRPAVYQSQRIGPAVMKALIPRSRLQLWAIAQAIRLLLDCMLQLVGDSPPSEEVRQPCWMQ